MFGLDPDTIREIKEAIAKVPAIEKVLLYGSRAKGNYRNGSDIDFTLVGKNLNLDNSVYPLMEELDELYLPYSFDISIINHIDNLALIQHIKEEGKIFYQKEKDSSLPKGWEVKPLKDLCEVFSDGDWIETKNQSTEGIRLVQTGNIGFGFFKNKQAKARFISSDTFSKLKCTEIYPGDLLVSRLPDPVGKSCIIPNLSTRMITGVDCTIVRTKKELSPQFLRFYQMSNKYLNEINTKVTGTTRSRISRKNLGLINIPIPPLFEQKRIMEKLDKAFAAIGQAKAYAEQNLQNAKELFQSKLQEIFDNGKLKVEKEEWQEKTLEEVAEIFGRGKSKHRPRNDKRLYGGAYPFIQTGDVRNCHHYISDFTQTYNEFGLAQSKLWPKGTICITIAANIAETGILSFDACFPDSIIGIVLEKKSAHLDFVEYLLQYFKAHLQSLGKGSAQDNINLGTFKNKKFPFPSVKEQKQIVEKLDALSAETKKLERIYEQKLENLEELKKSLLQKAFKGEL